MKALDLTNRFRREADAYYVEAKRSTVSSIAQIPVWMYGVLVVLGWNEAMTVLFNPLYFVTLLVGLVFAYVDPLFSLRARKGSSPANEQVYDRADEYGRPAVPSVEDDRKRGTSAVVPHGGRAAVIADDMAVLDQSPSTGPVAGTLCTAGARRARADAATQESVRGRGRGPGSAPPEGGRAEVKRRWRVVALDSTYSVLM
jgi:hypothetical protein